jgi:hypothetical protein
VAFPRRSTRADLGDFLRRMRIGTEPGLFLAIAVLGVVVALGTRTPYYRFLVQSFGALFRAIRAPARGIVLFDLALGVLAAWGLVRLSRGRRWTIPVALLLVGFEYRAFPVEIGPVERDPAPVYRWLADLSIPGAVIEWPFAADFDVEYEFRSTTHWKPLVNGYSGFAPPHYRELAAEFAKRPIGPEVWTMMKARGACLLVFHPLIGDEPERGAYADLLRQGVSSGRLLALKAFPGGRASDLVFRFADCPGLDPRIPEAEKRPAAEDVARKLASLMSPPFGYIDVPARGAAVASGSAGFGWALDDSGVAEVLVSADGAPARPAAIGQPHPGVVETYPGYPGADRPGFVFTLPALPAGPHTITVTIVAKDGGKGVLTHGIVVK